MAAAREERHYDPELGTGGKFRKRRPKASTPYDRPAGGWLSKLADPAHRLISAGAHRLFSSAFRNGLLPPPSPEASREPGDKQQVVSSDPPGAQEVLNNRSNSSNRGGLTELEQVLMQKTFSRAEVDRLTTLLCSRSDEMLVKDEEKRFEMVPPKKVTFLEGKEGYSNTPLQENMNKNHPTSTPVVRAVVLDDGVASPAEIAKAYMGSRPSKVSPSMLGFWSQTFREDSNVINSPPPLPPRSPIMSLVPRSSDHFSVPLNGFMTPRSRGRSSIHNMAQPPYSRVNRTSAIKNAAPITDTYGWQSSSKYDLKLNRPSGSQQRALKRWSSVLDNDIGSVGPMRRIRQKANIVSRKGLSLPIPVQYPSSSIRMLTEKDDNIMPDTTFTPVPSKSKEMASKILQQLEKFTPKEKSPTKFSPSMLCGKALKSLENPDSSKVFKSVHDNNKLDGLIDLSLPDAQKSTFQKKNQGAADAPTKFMSLCDASADMSMNTMVSDTVTVPTVNIDNTSLTNTIAHPPPLKKQTFQVNAREDFLDLDEHILSNGVASTDASIESKAKLDNSVPVIKTVTPEAVKVAKSLSEIKPLAGSVFNEKINLGASDGSVVVEKNSGLPLVASSMTVQPAVEATQTSFASDKSAFSKESNDPHPIFNSGDKDAPSNESGADSPAFSLGPKNADKSSQSLFVSSSTLADSSGFKLVSTSATTAGAVDSAPEVPVSAEARSENNSKSGLKSEVLITTPETAQFSAIPTPVPSTGMFTFGGSSSSTLNNGSHSSSTNPLSSSMPMPHLFSGSITSQNSFSSAAFAPVTNYTPATTITSSNLPLSAPMSSSIAAPIIKFGSPVVPSSSALISSAGSGVDTGVAMVKQDTSSGTSLPSTSIGSCIFGFSAPASSIASSQSLGSTPFGNSSGSLSSPAGSADATVTVNLPTLSGSSASTPSFGLSSSSSFAFCSSAFGSSTPAGILLSTGSGFGASSSANTVSSSSGTDSGLFGSSEQPTKSPIFGSFSSTSSSTVFSFGATPAPVASTTTASVSLLFGSGTAASPPMPFGSSASSGDISNITSMPFGSTTGSSSGSLFSFTSTAAGSTNGAASCSGLPFPSVSPATSSQSVFGNSTPVFGFAAARASAGNDQMNTEDSMTEDNVQASTATAPIFPQQPFSSAPSSFTFGSSASVGANPFQFGGQQQNTATQPFQFGGQQSTATQQTLSSTFQASGSLDFNGSGNFSLGSGGGDKSNRRIVRVNKGKYRRK